MWFFLAPNKLGKLSSKVNQDYLTRLGGQKIVPDKPSRAICQMCNGCRVYVATSVRPHVSGSNWEVPKHQVVRAPASLNGNGISTVLSKHRDKTREITEAYHIRRYADCYHCTIENSHISNSTVVQPYREINYSCADVPVIEKLVVSAVLSCLFLSLLCHFFFSLIINHDNSIYPGLGAISDKLQNLKCIP